MDEQALLMKNLLDQMYALMQQSGVSGPPLRLQNGDGSINYRNLLKLLQSDDYSTWREENPTLASEAGARLRTDIGTQMAQTGLTIGKLGFAIKQIRDAEQIDDTPPNFPVRPRRNQYLRQGLADTFRMSREGLGAAERSQLNQQLQQDFARNQQRILQSSGGQSGGVQSNMQVLARQQQLGRQQAAALNERARRQNQAQFNALIPQSIAEDRQQYQYGLDRFRYRDMPVYNQRLAAKERLMQAGYTNLDAGTNALFRDMSGLAQMFNGQVPGAAYSNAIYESIPDGPPLQAVFQNPVLEMQIDLPEGPIYDNMGVSGPLGGGYNIHPGQYPVQPQRQQGLPAPTYTPQSEMYYDY